MMRPAVVLSILYLFLASPVAAQGGASGTTFKDFVDGITGFVDSAVIPLLYILAFLFFVFGIFRYFFTGGQENRETGKAFVLWSLVGMVVLFGVWGLVHLFLSIIPGA